MSDTLVALGILSMTVGAWLLHPSAGLLLLGGLLLFIGARLGGARLDNEKENDNEGKG